MTIYNGILDGYGTGNKLRINGEGEITATIHQHPPINENISSIPLREYLKNSSNSSNMVVDGSTTNVPFSVSAVSNYDVYIKVLSVVIVDAGATLAEFGNLSALANGVVIEWDTQDIGTTTINSGIKTNFEFFRQSLEEPIISSNVVSTSEGILVNIDFEKLFGLQYGLRLRKGTNDKISLIIRDNMTGIDQFDAVAYGIKI